MSGFGIADVMDDDTPDELRLKVMNWAYEDRDEGTLVHLFGRDADLQLHHIEVDGHDPYFYVASDDYDDSVERHDAVRRVEHTDADGNSFRSLHDETLVRIVTYKSSSVADVRELFERTWEADVFYDRRWAIDNDIKTGAVVDTSAPIGNPSHGDVRVHTDDVTPLPVDDVPDVPPRLCILDIEVGGEGAVPDADRATRPVISVVLEDTYRDEQIGLLLSDDGHPDDIDTACDRFTVYDDEQSLLHDCNRYIASMQPDILLGWYSDSFDIPYLINRSRNLDVYNVHEWSPLGDVYQTRFEPVVKGVSTVDALDAYEKTQIHELDSYKLEDVAQRELGEGKDTVEGDHTQMWRDDPAAFIEYNRRDVELVRRINDTSGAIDMLDNLRAVAGVSWDSPIGGNIDMMDVLFLRKAREYGYVLPTAEYPDVQTYHGAYVFDPEPGIHRNCVYPDYASLYPNIVYQNNISPETLIGTADELERSEYDEADCVWSYIDTQTPPARKRDVNPTDRMEKVYFLKPRVKEGFVRSVIDDVMGIAAQYSGGMYEAAKRVRNSVYGVLGDSDSYNKGFRLYDWRMAEAVTLGGQRVLKQGADIVIDAIDDRYHPAVVGGDTDSFITSLDGADGPETALHVAQDAADRAAPRLDQMAVDVFGLDTTDESRIDLEIETVAESLFIKAKDGESTKKRYAQRVVWDDTDGWLDTARTEIKGFEVVRSDVAPVTKDVQRLVLERILDHGEAAESDVKPHVCDVLTAIIDGEMDPWAYAIPFGIGQPLSEYGTPDRTPQPPYRGARYANQHIYGSEAIAENDKPRYWYIVEGAVPDGYPSTYTATTAEDDTFVDAVAVLNASDMPDGFTIDRPKMATKTVVRPLIDIVDTMGWGDDWMQQHIEQVTPSEYYRDQAQHGLADFM